MVTIVDWITDNYTTLKEANETQRAMLLMLCCVFDTGPWNLTGLWLDMELVGSGLQFKCSNILRTSICGDVLGRLIYETRKQGWFVCLSPLSSKNIKVEIYVLEKE